MVNKNKRPQEVRRKVREARNISDSKEKSRRSSKYKASHKGKRRCLVTYQRQNQSQLLRFVSVPEGVEAEIRVYADIWRQGLGRGFWVDLDSSPAASEIKRFEKRQQLSWSLMKKQTAKVAQKEMLQLLGLANRSKSVIIGSDPLDAQLRKSGFQAFNSKKIVFVVKEATNSSYAKSLENRSHALFVPIEGREIAQALGLKETTVKYFSCTHPVFLKKITYLNKVMIWALDEY